MKILIIRFSSIGDIVLTSPVIRALAQNADNQIHYLTKASYEELVVHNPYLHKIHLLHNSLPKVIKELKKENFDLIIDLHRNLRSQRVKLSLRKPARSFNKLNFQKFLRTQFKIDKLPKKHIVDRYYDTLKPLGIKADGQGLDFFPGPEAEAVFADLRPNLPEKYFIVALGGKFETKKYPVDKLLDLIPRINSKVILLGGSDEYENAQKITKNLTDKTINLCAQTTINVSALIIKHAQAVVTNDTGLMHIAAAFHKNIVSIWGNTIPEFGMTPFFGQNKVENLIAEVKGLSCRPCSKLGKSSCPKKHFRCMYDIDNVSIADFCNSL